LLSILIPSVCSGRLTIDGYVTSPEGMEKAKNKEKQGRIYS